MHISYLKVSASRESGSEQKMKKKPRKKNPIIKTDINY